jgi:hypothetical protein
MPNCHPCKHRRAPNCCRNLAWCYLLTFAPIGSELVLLITLEVLLWIA